METDDEKRQEYIIKRDLYCRLRDGQLKLKRGLQEKINNIDFFLNSERPTTDNGELVCSRCDCISMKHEGKSPLDKHKQFYSCEICGYSEEIIYLIDIILENGPNSIPHTKQPR